MKKENKVMLTSMIVNSFLSIIKIIVGIVGKSSSLIADGIHSFSDLFTDVFAIFGNLLSRKPADEKHPFGHGKLEYLTSIGIGLVILFVGFSIIYNSYDNKIVIPSILVVLVSLFTIVSKYLLASYITRKGKEYKNNILISSGRESSMDVLS
jgi:cation diffusion facilitator family transporter